MNLNDVSQAAKHSNAVKELSSIWVKESTADGQTMTAQDPAVTMLYVFRGDRLVEDSAVSQCVEKLMPMRKRLQRTQITSM